MDGRRVVHRYEELPEDIRDFLERLRSNDIPALEELVTLGPEGVRDMKEMLDGWRFRRRSIKLWLWVGGGTFTVVAGLSLIWDRAAAIFSWLQGGKP